MSGGGHSEMRVFAVSMAAVPSGEETFVDINGGIRKSRIGGRDIYVGC